MTVRVRYRAMEMSEGVVETIDATHFEILGDSTIKLFQGAKVCGFVHPLRWDSVYQVPSESERAKP